MKTKNLTDLQISELTDLTSHLANEIESCNHVSQFLPKNILNSILEFNNKLINELNKREVEQQEKETFFILFGIKDRQHFAHTFTLFDVKNNVGEYKDTEMFYTLQENLQVFETAIIKPIEVWIDRQTTETAMLKRF